MQTSVPGRGWRLAVSRCNRGEQGLESTSFYPQLPALKRAAGYARVKEATVSVVDGDGGIERARLADETVAVQTATKRAAISIGWPRYGRETSSTREPARA